MGQAQWKQTTAAILAILAVILPVAQQWLTNGFDANGLVQILGGATLAIKGVGLVGKSA